MPWIPETITIDWLEGRRACAADLERFRAAFGAAAPVTRPAARRAAEAGLDLDWFAGAVLDPDEFQAYWTARHAAWVVYCDESRSGTAAAWATFVRARAEVLCDALGLP